MVLVDSFRAFPHSSQKEGLNGAPSIWLSPLAQGAEGREFFVPVNAAYSVLLTCALWLGGVQFRDPQNGLKEALIWVLLRGLWWE